MAFQFYDICMSYHSVYEQVEGFSGVKQNVVDNARSNRTFSMFHVSGCSFLVYGRFPDRDLDILTVLAKQSAFQEQELNACVTMFHSFRQKFIYFLLPITSYISAKSEQVAGISYRIRSLCTDSGTANRAHPS